MTNPSRVSPIDPTLRWIVLMFRLMGWIWCVALVWVTIDREPGVDREILLLAGAIATVFAALTVIAARRGFLHRAWFVLADGLVVLYLIAAAWLAGASDFINGGYPASWIFVVAYAFTLRTTLITAFGLTLIYALMHVLLEVASLEVRTIGSIQYVVYALLAGWTFDTLREREALRIEAEAKLAAEQEAAVRHHERAELARRLHDSVLQTLHAIRTDAGDASQVRYLARRQERELRQTIDEYESPYDHSFRAELLRARNDIEDLFSVEIEAVIRTDVELTPALSSMVSAAHEAMANAAKHSGVSSFHLYSEIGNGTAAVNVHDRGRGFGDDSALAGPRRVGDSLIARIEAVGGHVAITSSAGQGTDVSITVAYP